LREPVQGLDVRDPRDRPPLRVRRQEGVRQDDRVVLTKVRRCDIAGEKCVDRHVCRGPEVLEVIHAADGVGDQPVLVGSALHPEGIVDVSDGAEVHIGPDVGRDHRLRDRRLHVPLHGRDMRLLQGAGPYVVGHGV
jgi:hypothetical protein